MTGASCDGSGGLLVVPHPDFVEFFRPRLKPIDRFGLDLNRIRFLAPSELFYAEATRKVKKDNIFSFASRRYETTVDLRDREVQLRYDRLRGPHSAVIVYHKGQRMGPARLLNAVANGLLRR